MNRNRASSRLARRQTKNSEKTADIVNGKTSILNQNGQPIDEIDLMFGNMRSKFYPIYTPINKKVNTHNLAEIPSLQSDEDSILGVDNVSQNGEFNERNVNLRKQYGKRKNANGLIEARNKFRQLLNQMQSKIRPNFNGNAKNDSAFDGYDLKTRRVKFEPRKSRKEANDQVSIHKNSNDFTAKLFDKTMDLSHYCKMNPKSYIPLYPLCRIWARSNYGLPESLKTKKSVPVPPLTECPDPDGPYSADPVDVWHLPKPEPLPVDEDGNPIMLRIPKKIRASKPKAISPDTSFLNSMENSTAQELLKLHMPKWKQTRLENIEALKENEKRFRHSFAVLKSIFDKANNSETESKITYYKNPPYEPDHSEPQHPEKLDRPESPNVAEFLEPQLNSTINDYSKNHHKL